MSNVYTEDQRLQLHNTRNQVYVQQATVRSMVLTVLLGNLLQARHNAVIPFVKDIDVRLEHNDVGPHLCAYARPLVHRCMEVLCASAAACTCTVNLHACTRAHA